jgi:hypothetical protein
MQMITKMQEQICENQGHGTIQDNIRKINDQLSIQLQKKCDLATPGIIVKNNTSVLNKISGALIIKRDNTQLGDIKPAMVTQEECE